MDCNISKSLCSITFCKINQLVDLLSGHATLAFCVDATDSSACFNRILKYNKFAVFDSLCHINQLHAETDIRFIRTESVHCFLPGHSLDRELYIDIQYIFEQMRKQSLIDINDIINIYKRKFHIHLCKFRLTVCTKVFITETFYDLEIAVISGAHQQLFEDLR